MNSYVVVAFFACLAVANAGYYAAAPSAKILQGPSSKTTLVGPEGSIISAVAPGGQIVHEEHTGFIAHTGPVVAHAAPAHILTHSATVVAHVAHSAPIVAHHAAPSTVVAHSSAYEHDSVIVAGPSGTISTGHATHAAPIVAHAAPIVAHAAPVVSHAAPIVAHAVPVVSYAAAHDHEGQYVHDHSETLYDDGSYKPHLYHH